MVSHGVPCASATRNEESYAHYYDNYSSLSKQDLVSWKWPESNNAPNETYSGHHHGRAGGFAAAGGARLADGANRQRSGH